MTLQPDRPRPTQRPRFIFWTVIITVAFVVLGLLCLGGFTLAAHT